MGDPHELDGRFVEHHPLVQRLVSRIDGGRMSVLCDREPVAKWGSGAMTLVGDAAHPMLLALGQSAAMALEDAVCLADMVERHPDDAPAALRAYENARYLRTGRVQLAVRLVDEVFHASGVARELRGQLLKSQADTGLLNLDWLYGGPGDW